MLGLGTRIEILMCVLDYTILYYIIRSDVFYAAAYVPIFASLKFSLYCLGKQLVKQERLSPEPRGSWNPRNNPNLCSLLYLHPL